MRRRNGNGLDYKGKKTEQHIATIIKQIEVDLTVKIDEPKITWKKTVERNLKRLDIEEHHKGYGKCIEESGDVERWKIVH